MNEVTQDGTRAASRQILAQMLLQEHMEALMKTENSGRLAKFKQLIRRLRIII